MLVETPMKRHGEFPRTGLWFQMHCAPGHKQRPQPARFPIWLLFIFCIIASLWKSAFAAESISDLLIVLDADGRSHTVQHTISTDGQNLQLKLPGSVVPQEVMFFGPESDAAYERYRQNPATLELDQGSGFARYQHQYGEEVEQYGAGYFVLNTSSIPDNVTLSKPTALVNPTEPVESQQIQNEDNQTDKPLLSQSGITWVLPTELEFVTYTATEPESGRWVANDNMLTFHHLGKSAVTLSITYKNKLNINKAISELCMDSSPPSDNCSEDKDEDGIPDYRDICRSAKDSVNNIYGCLNTNNIVLADIVFVTGRTYLDVTARKLLDKVAHAILKTENTHYEVSAHTDNEGAAENNQQLSQKRADAVRQYLMLKGVNPNTVKAAGYGEKYPIRDNASMDGKRANRRIELTVLE